MSSLERKCVCGFQLKLLLRDKAQIAAFDCNSKIIRLSNQVNSNLGLNSLA